MISTRVESGFARFARSTTIIQITKINKKKFLPFSTHGITSKADGTFVPSHTFPFSFLIELGIEIATENVDGPPDCQNDEVQTRHQMSNKRTHNVLR